MSLLFEVEEETKCKVNYKMEAEKTTTVEDLERLHNSDYPQAKELDELYEKVLEAHEEYSITKSVNEKMNGLKEKVNMLNLKRYEHYVKYVKIYQKLNGDYIKEKVFKRLIKILENVTIPKKYKVLNHDLCTTRNRVLLDRYYENVMKSVYLCELANIYQREMCMKNEDYYNLCCSADKNYKKISR